MYQQHVYLQKSPINGKRKQQTRWVYRCLSFNLWTIWITLAKTNSQYNYRVSKHKYLPIKLVVEVTQNKYS